MKTVEIGKIGESIAAKYLKKQGYKIIARNQHQSHNEIDIIASNKNFLVFVEVKTRSSQEDLYLPFGSPASAVDRNKQARTIRAAQSYIVSCSDKEKKKQPRMDVIEVYLKQDTKKLLHLNHIENAFGM